MNSEDFMTKRTSKIAAVLAALPILAFSGLASASSHREAPAISNDPAADNTDVWAWVTPGTHDTLHIVAAYIPLEEPSGGPNFHKFSDEVLYEIHITKGAGVLDDALTYQFKFTTAPPPHTDPDGSKDGAGNPNSFGGREFFAQLAGSNGGGWQAQTYTVTKIVGGTATQLGMGLSAAPPNAGPVTDAVLGRTYDDTFAATFIHSLGGSEGAVWAGPRDDGFYVDLGGIFDLANLRLQPAPNKTAKDGVAGYNCHAIAIDVPITTILGHAATNSDDDLIGVWASASRRKVTILRNDGTNTLLGPWRQVSRLGLPLINEAVIGLQDKDKYNRTQPKDDLANFANYFLNPVVVRDAEAVGIYTAYGIADPTDVGGTDLTKNRLDIVGAIDLNGLGHNIQVMPGQVGDVLRLDASVDSQFPNGRRVGGGAAPNQDQVDVTDVILDLALTGLTVPTGCGGPAAGKVGDCVDSNDANYLTSIPYLALPWRGYDQGHGKITSP
ncbi:MAG TPA: DUF4331 domain-containing protein [Minicystis sp.]|nr:DUF4331 domain-containing protein [Minicystis sp.]